MSIEGYLIPYIISQAAALGLVFICCRLPKAGRIVWGILFLGAGLFNLYHAWTAPEIYVQGYGPTAVWPFYKRFIYGFFSAHTTSLVTVIALGQMASGLFLLMKKPFFMLGVTGGVIFLVAISPLGIGSAFPATLLMAVSLLLASRSK